MHTPWGPLNTLDLSDHDLAAKVLGADKHQLVEGLVVECIFDQIVANISSASGQSVVALDVDSVVVDTGQSPERWLVFVWAKTATPRLRRYLIALEKSLVPYLITYSEDEAEFLAAKIKNGKREEAARPLPELMLELSGGRYNEFSVSDSVKNLNRQRQAFWGFISDYYKNSIAKKLFYPAFLSIAAFSLIFVAYGILIAFS